MSPPGAKIFERGGFLAGRGCLYTHGRKFPGGENAGRRARGKTARLPDVDRHEFALCTPERAGARPRMQHGECARDMPARSAWESGSGPDWTPATPTLSPQLCGGKIEHRSA